MSVRFRKAFSAIIIFSLFLMSSWASACDLSCTLAKFHSGCQTQSTLSPKQPTTDSMPPDMPMGEDMETAQAQNSHTGDSDLNHSAAVSHWDTKLCIHEPCSQISAPAFPRQANHSQLVSLHSMSICIAIPVSSSSTFHKIRIGPSPPNVLATLSLRATTLRI
jgi:hypothetical protein